MTQYDYTNQAWVVDGLYVSCAHEDCRCLGADAPCYGTRHAGEPVDNAAGAFVMEIPLAKQLLAHHQFKNGCWFTDYSKIPGLNLLASTTNGTSGIGKYQGRKLYWYFNHRLGAFEVENA